MTAANIFGELEQFNAGCDLRSQPEGGRDSGVHRFSPPSVGCISAVKLGVRSRSVLRSITKAVAAKIWHPRERALIVQPFK